MKEEGKMLVERALQPISPCFHTHTSFSSEGRDGRAGRRSKGGGLILGTMMRRPPQAQGVRGAEGQRTERSPIQVRVLGSCVYYRKGTIDSPLMEMAFQIVCFGMLNRLIPARV